MSALDELIENVKRANEGLEPHYTWKNNGTGINLAYNMTTSSVTDPAEAELSALRAEVERLKTVGRRMLNSLPISEIEIAREALGNTNTRIILVARDELAAALNAPSEGQKRE